MSWTARQARYNTRSQVVVEDEARLVKHYVLTRHGAVARTFLPGALLVEVALWRRNNRHAQYQGTVELVDGQYVATSPAGVEVARTVDYLDAEAALLPLRNRRRSNVEHHWPVTITAALHAPKWEQCQECGWEVRGGACTRPDLHWTLETLGAQPLEREAHTLVG